MAKHLIAAALLMTEGASGTAEAIPVESTAPPKVAIWFSPFEYSPQDAYRFLCERRLSAKSKSRYSGGKSALALIADIHP